MKYLITLLLCINVAFAQCPNGTYVNIIINPDQYPEETSWAIITPLEDTIVTGGPYEDIVDYQPQVIQVCIPNGDYLFNIADQYGDGMAGSLWGGQDGSYYVVHCGDTLVQPDSADFGYAAFHGFTLEDCAPPPPVYGCMQDDFLEFLPEATVDTGMCFTPKLFGCTDSLAFNYDPMANIDEAIDSCAHTLELTDLAGNGWAGSYLMVYQGYNFIGEFTLENGFDTTFTFNLNISEPVRVQFNITQQSDFTAVQCGYSIYSEEYVAIEIEGGFVNPIPPFVYIFGEPNCGDNCIDRTYGCIDTTALNYNDSVNTDDGSCYYIAGCMNPSYIEYNSEADFDDGSCETLIVLGCMDSTALNYNPEANVELEGSCIEVVLGCMDDDAFNYNPNANVEDGSCIPLIFGCIDPTAFNYCDTCNTDNGSCIDVINGCTDTTAMNYNPLANTDNNSCIYPLPGCTDPTAINFDELANIADSSCYYSAGCASGDVYYTPNACFEWVIEVDPYCCDDTWDNTCQDLYVYCEQGWSGPVSITERINDLIIYPNPTSDYINISKKVDVQLFNMLGKLVISKNNISSLDVSKINPGIYSAVIYYKNIKINKRIIKK
tara:strand:- start:1020 stop:2831 length:1812 start_codon:yes stop_codon:yes gene_type:complete